MTPAQAWHQDGLQGFCLLLTLKQTSITQGYLSADGRLYRHVACAWGPGTDPHFTLSYWPTADYRPDPAYLAAWRATCVTEDDWGCYEALHDEWPTYVSPEAALEALEAQHKRVRAGRPERNAPL